MNQKQKQYAFDRVAEIADRKVAAVIAKYTTPGVKLDPATRLEAFKAGRYIVRDDVKRIYSSTEIEDVITFIDESPLKKDQKTIDREVAKIRKKAQEIQDELMLGDCEKALELIRQFDNF